MRMRIRGAVGVRSGDLPRGLDAVQHRHSDVHEHDVRAVLGAQLHCLGAVGGAGDDGDVRLRAEQRGESLSHDLVVVGDQRPDHEPSPSVGSSTSTTKPPPSAAPQENVPPAIVARSRMPTIPWPVSISSAGPGPWSRTLSCRTPSP